RLNVVEYVYKLVQVVQSLLFQVLHLILRCTRQVEKESEESREPPSKKPSPFGGGGGGDHHCKGISKQPNQPSKSRKYREEYIQYGFTCIIINEVQHPQCVVCTEVLANENLKPVKMLRHLKTKHPFLARELQGQKKVISSQTTIPTKAQKASYEVACLIAQAKKPHTIGETLIKPAAVAICWTMHGDKQVQELEAVPLSDGKISRRITDMAQDIKCQLIDRVKQGTYALQLHESLDVSNSANLLVFVRYSFDGTLNEDMLFCAPLEAKCTGEDIFMKLDSNLKEEGLSWDQCIGVCTDDAAAMLGKKKGLKARVLQVAPHINFTHCIIHREALVSKTLHPELNSVLETATKMVNYIKSRPLNTRLFATLCSELGSEHQGLLFHSDVRWISRGKVLIRLYELRDEVRLFLMEHDSQLADHLTDPDWLTRLAYLSCIFDKLNGLNMSLQGENTSIMTLNDKIRSFKRKLDRWTARVEMGRIDMFPELEEFMEENGLNGDTVTEFITSHLQALLEHFNKFFPEETAREKYDWIRSPFTVTTTSHLSSDMEDALVELSSDRTLMSAFNSKPLSEFWISVQKEYPQLSRAALDILTPFGCSYLCEKTFSAPMYIKNKYRSCLNMEDDLRVAVSKIKPRIDLLCSTHSAHPSH
uniref:HAT C-terminal dimerisation domain-containing protein n=1 Tax=Amphiprion ocellaris TaxID=80972 RepID=A0A3Q1AGL5_AMPOC